MANNILHNADYFNSSKNIKNFEDYIRSVENRMGMSTEEFQHKLENSLPERIEQAKIDQSFLYDWLENDNGIYTRKDEGNKEKLILQDDEFFIQVFNPEVRFLNEIPTTWFLSNFNNLVYIRKNGRGSDRKIYWIKPSKTNEDDRACVGFVHPITGRTRTIRFYTLISHVFGSDVFGKANDYLDLWGTYAYGGLQSDFELNTHHPYPVTLYKELEYDWRNMQTVDGLSHDLIRYIRENHALIRAAETLDEKNELRFDMMQGI